MKKIILLTIGLICSFVALAKAPEITFEKTNHDFGTIREKDGEVTCYFNYTNTGDAPLALVTVSAPCGCTDREFSAKPLAPGKSEKIKITFDPTGKKGEFLSNIKVRTNVKDEKGKKKIINLTITGVVIPKK
ncbi:MAG: DUF1573 domain-containing protein [Bacteroides sp.]|nr:DUF1573 domain-containing protein [Bacteroides sp.]MCM1378554.1 DUF1573 domain-containing protein [Bacteroides sp.]MCM1444855.1 DUF1573 domain-containing protein [Prevotella sp.]